MYDLFEKIDEKSILRKAIHAINVPIHVAGKSHSRAFKLY